jgi:hypothetical protein
MAKEFNVMPNIRRPGSRNCREMILELEGAEDNLEKGAVA